jgi:secreted trypsin-like serine protease
LSFVSDQECGGIYGQDFEGEVMLCAIGAEESGADFCNGDVGSPLIAEYENGTKYLVGLASWGQGEEFPQTFRILLFHYCKLSGCGQQGFPGVYVEVQAFLEWINSNLI